MCPMRIHLIKGNADVALGLGGPGEERPGRCEESTGDDDETSRARVKHAFRSRSV